MRTGASGSGASGVGEQAVVVELGTSPMTIVGDAEIEDEVPQPGVLEAVDELDVAVLLPFTGRAAALRAHLMAIGSRPALAHGRAEERAETRYHPGVCFGGT